MPTDAPAQGEGEPHPEDRPGHLILAEEEAAEDPFHEGEPAQPPDYVQVDDDG
jgi:hypothetical protein